MPAARAGLSGPRWKSRRCELPTRTLEGTRARLQQALSVDAGELESIMRLIGSRLEASVRAHLGETIDAGPP